MNFGVFNRFWDKRPNHLPFLGLVDESDEEYERTFQRLLEQWPEGVPLPVPTPRDERFTLSSSVQLLETIMTESTMEDLGLGFGLLLDETDWRAHIVAAIFAAMLYKSKKIAWTDQIWRRLSHGSWTSPQLCVVLSYIDSDFRSRAHDVISAGGGVVYTDELSLIESHIKRGPSGKSVEDRKLVQALQYLTTSSISNENANEEDNGGAIAQDWKEKFIAFIDKWQPGNH